MTRRNGSDTIEMIDGEDEAEETSPLVPNLQDRIRSSTSASSEFSISIGTTDRFRQTEIVEDEEDMTPLSAMLGMRIEVETESRGVENSEEMTRDFSWRHNHHL